VSERAGSPLAARILLAPFRAWSRFFFGPIDPRPLALLRIAAGILAALTIAGLMPQTTFYHSDAGWLPVERIASKQWWTLLHAVTSPEGVRAFAVVSFFAALCMAAGWHARLASFATFVALTSFVHRDPLINYGGDSALRLLVFYVAIGPSGCVWSVDSLLRRLRAGRALLDRGETDLRRARRLAPPARTIEAWPIRLIQIQVAIVYFMSGWAKLHGSTWHDGSALPLALLNPQLSRFDFSLVGGIPLVALLTRLLVQVTLWWEVLFAAMVWFRWGRLLALAMGVGVHIGIWVLMRVHWFGAVMIASYVAFIPGERVRGLALRARRRLRGRARGRRGRLQLQLIYDDACPDCRRRALLFLLADPRGAIEPVAASDARRYRRAAPRLAPGDVRHRLFALPPAGEPLEGFDAARAAAARTPALFPLALLAFVPGLAALGRAAARELERRHPVVAAREPAPEPATR
jgi:hypothetical protein